jgi:hypothetical protein
MEEYSSSMTFSLVPIFHFQDLFPACQAIPLFQDEIFAVISFEIIIGSGADMVRKSSRAARPGK